MTSSVDKSQCSKRSSAAAVVKQYKHDCYRAPFSGQRYVPL